MGRERKRGQLGKRKWEATERREKRRKETDGGRELVKVHVLCIHLYISSANGTAEV